MKTKIDYRSKVGKELGVILGACCEAYDVRPQDVRGISRRRGGIMEARQMYCYVAHRKFEHTLSKIGGIIKRDHSSALHSVKSVQNLIDTNYQDTEDKFKLICKNLLHLDRVMLVNLARDRVRRRDKMNERDKRFIKQFSY